MQADQLRLKQQVFQSQFNKLVKQGIVKEEEVEWPDFGGTVPPSPEPEQDDGEGDEDEDDEEALDDDSDEDGEEKQRKRGPRAGTALAKRDGKDDTDARKRRGRPPKVDTPMEARIKAIIKGIRKYKDKDGNPKASWFEKLPDREKNEDYFKVIKEPIALDQIKRDAKRKKYNSVDHFMKDMDIMFNNAKFFNEDGSVVYNAAVDLQKETRQLAEIEKARPDSDFVNEDGRLPMPEGILHDNELWKVGDWVHIRNKNDVTKPIPAQIYRTWSDADGSKWINACWFYRPEQTVHQYEKHFWPNEVVKTGQYRDHPVEEIQDRCLVMFVTRYFRGRPRNFPPDKEVYVCEARYNEERFKLNKIKTWNSCIPDEVRGKEKDYVMDIYDHPKRIKKIPSPIKHLLKDDAKETDELPTPTWGADNAPPIVGAVHRRPREENVSDSHTLISQPYTDHK